MADLMRQPQGAKEQTTLPQETQKQVKPFVDYLVNLEKKYYDSTLKPFPVHEGEMRSKAEHYFVERYNLLILGQKVLQEQFKKQEIGHEKFSPDSSFVKWEEKSLFGNDELLIDKKTPLQEQIGLSWDFMDRAYAVARSLYAERKYEESLAAFHFLRFLNPAVFEYWFGEACLLQELGKLEQAASIYNLSLTMQPNNPLVYFQIANCYSGLGDKESSLQALDFCIDYAKSDAGLTILLERAEQIKQSLRAQSI